MPNSIFIDQGPSVIDETRTRTHKTLYRLQTLISGKKDEANNYAGFHYTIGKETIKPVMMQVQKLADDCSGFQGFFILSSFGGGN